MAKNKLAIAAAAVLVAGGLAGRLYWPAIFGTAGDQKKVKATKLVYVEIRELTLRLADASTEHYIKLTPVLGVRADSAEDIAGRDPVIRDRLVTLVTARSSVELATPQGETHLKQDILETLRNDFGDEIVAVYFTGYLVE
jgi:flagellar protein FliL